MSLITKESLLEDIRSLYNDLDPDDDYSIFSFNIQIYDQLKNAYYLLKEMKNKDAEALIELNCKHKLFYIVKESLPLSKDNTITLDAMDEHPIEFICTDSNGNNCYLFTCYVFLLKQNEKQYLCFSIPSVSIRRKELINENESFYDAVSRFLIKVRDIGL